MIGWTEQIKTVKNNADTLNIENRYDNSVLYPLYSQSYKGKATVIVPK